MEQKIQWKRKCPKCNKDLYYINKRGLTIANKLDKICKSCARKLNPNNSNIGKTYTERYGNFIANNICKKISKSLKGRTPWNKGKTWEELYGKEKSIKLKNKQSRKLKGNVYSKGKVHSKKTKLKMSVLNSGKNNPFYGKFHTIETRKKIRLSKINWIKENKNNGNQIFPFYNKKSIPILEQKAKELNITDLQHAENGGEFYITELGYWVDGYSKDKNIVIEVDEKHHFDINGNLKNKDINRQKEIIDFLKCQFIRIKI